MIKWIYKLALHRAIFRSLPLALAVTLTSAIFLPSNGFSSGQSTVIGRRADMIITYFAYKNAHEIGNWPSTLTAYINYDLLTKPQNDGKVRIDPEYMGLLEDLNLALEYRDWYSAREIRLYIEMLLKEQDQNENQCSGRHR